MGDHLFIFILDKTFKKQVRYVNWPVPPSYLLSELHMHIGTKVRHLVGRGWGREKMRHYLLQAKPVE